MMLDRDHTTTTAGGHGSFRLDVVGYLIVVACLAASFQQDFDLYHDIGSTVTYLNGQILDFYDVNLAKMGLINYLPSTYIVFAVWAVPLRAVGYLQDTAYPTGLIFLWFKLLTTAAYFGCGWTLYRIGREFDLQPTGARWLAAAWLTTPVAVYSQFIFGQTDSFTVLFMLLGLLAFLRGHMKTFALMLGIGMTFKYFPAFLFFPLVLLVEKRARALAVLTGLFVAPVAAEVVPYLGSPAFRENVLGWETAAKAYASTFVVEPERRAFSVLFFLWFALCGWAYLRPVPDRVARGAVAVAMSAGIAAVVFVLIPWHPQWLMIATPFLVLNAMLRADRRFLLVLDIVLMLAFVAFTVREWPHNADQRLLVTGILGRYNPALASADTAFRMEWLMPLGSSTLWLALINASLVVSGFSWASTGLAVVDLNPDRDRGLPAVLRFRFIVGTLIFVAPAALAYVLTYLRHTGG